MSLSLFAEKESLCSCLVLLPVSYICAKILARHTVRHHYQCKTMSHSQKKISREVVTWQGITISHLYHLIRNLAKKIYFFLTPNFVKDKSRFRRQKWLLVKQKCLFQFYDIKKNKSDFLETEVTFGRQKCLLIYRSDFFLFRKNRSVLSDDFFTQKCLFP